MVEVFVMIILHILLQVVQPLITQEVVEMGEHIYIMEQQ
jgi:hypothetical protein